MAIQITVSSESEVRDLVEQYLQSKGVDAGTARYLADLAAKSERGKKMASGQPIHPMGGCSVPGLFPG